MIRTVPTGDLGLDVLLGGGWRLVTRLPDRESTSVVVRGGSGAGKTILGIHVALELARALGGDVAVGCVEILPSEYIAQLESARPRLPASRVASLPSHAASDEGPRVFVGLLADLDPDAPDLVGCLEVLGRDVTDAGGKPVVFVVDSLIEGYGVGSSASRVSVDAVMKFAAQGGHGLVLCEEVVTDTPSPWVFAADTVLQLGVESRERGRWIEVRKHRFGPCASGRHELDLVGHEHPEAFPAPAAWMARGLESILSVHGWRFGSNTATPSLPHEMASNKPFEGSLVFVTGQRPLHARGFANGFRSPSARGAHALIFELDPLIVAGDGRAVSSGDAHYLPTCSGAAHVLRIAVELFGRHLQASTDPTIERVLLGDMGVVLDGEDAMTWVAATRALAALVRSAGWAIPIIVHGRSYGTSNAHAALASLADVDATIQDDELGVGVSVTQRCPPLFRRIEVRGSLYAKAATVDVGTRLRPLDQ